MNYTANIPMSHALILLMLLSGCTPHHRPSAISLHDSGSTLKIIYDDPSALKPHWLAGTTFQGLITDDQVCEAVTIDVAGTANRETKSVASRVAVERI